MENKPELPEKKNGNKMLSILFLLLFLLAGGMAGYLYNEKTELETQLSACEATSTEIQEEKSRVIEELNGMMIKYDTLSAENDEMKEKLLEERQKIEKLIKEAKDKNWTIAKLRKETETLRTIMQGYVVTIDSLNTLAINLREEKEVITQELGAQKNKNTELAKANQDLSGMVKIGQRLEAFDITALPQRVKSNNVHRETTRADKTDKIKLCFIINKNEIAEAGTKTVYVRIIAPDATILPANDDTDGRFNFNGGSGEYSLKRDIEYKNVEQDNCFYYEIKGSIPAGKYIAEIYCDQADIGRVNFELK